MKKINDFVDEYGAVCHKHLAILPYWERGDSARETGTYWTLIPYHNMDFVFSAAFVVDKGSALCRHNYSGELWHRDPKEFSRDQWTALACAAVIWPDAIIEHILWQEQKKHHLRCQNKDIITWEYNLYIRMFCLWFLWPLLVFLDLGLLVNAIIRAIKNRNNSDDVGDDINVTTMIYVAMMVLPTPTSWLARFVYKRTHPGIQAAWDHYYRHPENPPINDVWRETISKYFT